MQIGAMFEFLLLHPLNLFPQASLIFAETDLDDLLI